MVSLTFTAASAPSAAGEAGPPADAAEDAGPPEDPPEAADPSAARWTPLFGLPMLFAGLAAAPGPGGPLAPVHCLATVKVRWAVAMLIEAALVAHGERCGATWGGGEEDGGNGVPRRWDPRWG